MKILRVARSLLVRRLYLVVIGLFLTSLAGVLINYYSNLKQQAVMAELKQTLTAMRTDLARSQQLLNLCIEDKAELITTQIIPFNPYITGVYSDFLDNQPMVVNRWNYKGSEFFEYKIEVPSEKLNGVRALVNIVVGPSEISYRAPDASGRLDNYAVTNENKYLTNNRYQKSFYRDLGVLYAFTDTGGEYKTIVLVNTEYVTHGILAQRYQETLNATTESLELLADTMAF